MSAEVPKVGSACAGSSHLFLHKVGNKCRNDCMQKHIIRQRITVDELKLDASQRLFVENVNMTGAGKRGTISYLCVLSLDYGHQWHLSVLLNQSMTTMIVMKAFTFSARRFSEAPSTPTTHHIQNFLPTSPFPLPPDYTINIRTENCFLIKVYYPTSFLP